MTSQGDDPDPRRPIDLKEGWDARRTMRLIIATMLILVAGCGPTEPSTSVGNHHPKRNRRRFPDRCHRDPAPPIGLAP